MKCLQLKTINHLILFGIGYCMLGTLLSCSTSSYNPFPDISNTVYVKSFPKNLTLQGDSVVLDEHSLGTAWLYVFDSYLITCSPGASVFFHIYDLNTGEYKGAFANKGRGAYEYSQTHLDYLRGEMQRYKS